MNTNMLLDNIINKYGFESEQAINYATLLENSTPTEALLNYWLIMETPLCEEE